MQSMSERLVQKVQQFQQTTGEDSMMVVIQKRDESMGVHKVRFSPKTGLLVDGRTPSHAWHVSAADFHPLQWEPTLLQ